MRLEPDISSNKTTDLCPVSQCWQLCLSKLSIFDCRNFSCCLFYIHPCCKMSSFVLSLSFTAASSFQVSHNNKLFLTLPSGYVTKKTACLLLILLVNDIVCPSSSITSMLSFILSIVLLIFFSKTTSQLFLNFQYQHFVSLSLGPCHIFVC